MEITRRRGRSGSRTNCRRCRADFTTTCLRQQLEYL
jgi:hypothetical protein